MAKPINSLELHYPVIQFLIISDTLQLSIDNVLIEQVSSVTSLKLCINENLTWHSHIDKLIPSAIRSIN